MVVSDSQLLREMADREAIRECLACYARGVDRSDADMVRRAYWPDIKATQLDFMGNAEEFIAWSFPQVATMNVITHLVSNILIRLNGDEATSESSFISYRQVDQDGRKCDFLGGGRYLDRFERRGGEWRIAERLVVTDWQRELSNADAEAITAPAGEKRWPDDISYKRLGWS